jgi:hypothetical protein
MRRALSTFQTGKGCVSLWDGCRGQRRFCHGSVRGRHTGSALFTGTPQPSLRSTSLDLHGQMNAIDYASLVFSPRYCGSNRAFGAYDACHRGTATTLLGCLHLLNPMLRYHIRTITLAGIREYAYCNMREQCTIWGRLVGVQVSLAESAAQQDTPAASWDAFCN